MLYVHRISLQFLYGTMALNGNLFDEQMSTWLRSGRSSTLRGPGVATSVRLRGRRHSGADA